VTVRVRTTLAATAAVSVALGLAAVLFVLSLERTLAGRVGRAAEAQVQQVAAALAAGDDPAFPVPDPALGVAVQILDADGEVVASNVPAWRQSIPLAAPRGVGPDRVVFFPDVAVASRDVATPDGLRRVVAASPLAEVARSVAVARQVLVVGVPVLVLLVAAGSWVLTGWALRPIEGLRAEAEDITSTTLDRQLPVPGTRDEVGRLAVTLNGMLDRLRDSAARQREFTSDASHELRGPIASSTTALEVALRRDGEAQLRDAATAVLHEQRRLAGLVDDLLRLARLEEPGAVARRQVDLADLAAEVLDDRVAPGDAVALREGRPVQATEGGARRRLTLDAAPAPLLGDPAALALVVRNLVDNALRHAASAVRVTVRPGALTVEDDGEGIPERDRDRVFERFTRVDPARVRHDGGVGLGLAIVRRVVAEHGGAVAADPSPDLGGARLRVTLPVQGTGRAASASSGASR